MLPDALAQILRVSTPGQVWPPREAEGGWVILQLEELQPAIFDKRLKQQLLWSWRSLAKEQMESKQGKPEGYWCDIGIGRKERKMQETHNSFPISMSGAVGAVFRHTLISNH